MNSFWLPVNEMWSFILSFYRVFAAGIISMNFIKFPQYFDRWCITHQKRWLSTLDIRRSFTSFTAFLVFPQCWFRNQLYSYISLLHGHNTFWSDSGNNIMFNQLPGDPNPIRTRKQWKQSAGHFQQRSNPSICISIGCECFINVLAQF